MTKCATDGPTQWRLYREFFRALANHTRFRIVQLLRQAPRHVGEIADRLELEQSRVSHNLACLLNCGFVLWEWQGKNKVYRLNPEVGFVLGGIEKHLARYAPALDSCQILEQESGPVVIVPRAGVARRSRRRDARRTERSLP